MISMGLTILMFLSPIFYPISALPEKYRIFLLFNPLTVVIEQVRDVLFFGKMPDMSVTLICCLGASVIAWLGFALFQKTRSGFADML
jgi:lipopolysaccharide transport system permease protein